MVVYDYIVGTIIYVGMCALRSVSDKSSLNVLHRVAAKLAFGHFRLSPLYQSLVLVIA